MEFMKNIPDKYYDLAIVDPPYGIGVTKNKRLNNNSKKDWDNEIPKKEYFDELFRVSKNQIIWGGNYFIEHLRNTRCFINWDKLNHSDTYADCEMAWTSFNANAKIFKFMWDGNRYGFEGNIKGVGMPSIRTHPTQKPIELYKWLLKNYATCPSCENKGWIWLTMGKQTDCPKCKGHKPKILDTHGGSMSIALACHDLGFDLDLCELDKDYFEAGVKRYEQHKKQLKLL